MNVSPRHAALAAALLLAGGCHISDPTPHPVVQEEPPAKPQSPLARPGSAAEALGPVDIGGNPLLIRPRPVTFDQWTIEQTALDSLVRIGKPAVPALVQLLDDPDAKIRAEAVVALARIGPDADAAVARLTTLIAADPDESVRKYAVRALGQIGPPAATAVPVLVEQLRADAAGPPAGSAPGSPPPMRRFDDEPTSVR